MRIDENQISEIVKKVLADVAGESDVNVDARSYKGVFMSATEYTNQRQTMS